MKTDSLSLSFLGKTVLIAFITLVAGNLLSFWVLYADTFVPISLPYRESFNETMRLRYRQFGGFWRIQEGALLQDDANGTDLLAVIPMTLSAAQPYHFETEVKIVKGPNGGGLMFNLQNSDNRQQSHLVRFGSDNGKNYLVFGYFDESSNFVAQGTATPPDLSQGARLAVDVHEENYDVLVNDQPLQRAVPLQYKGGKVALTTWFSGASFDEVALWAIDPQLPETTINTTAVNTDDAAAQQPPTAPTAQASTTKAAITDTKPIDTKRQATSVQGGGVTVSSNGSTSATVASRAITNSAVVASPILTTTLVAGELGNWTVFSGQWVYEQGKLVQTTVDGFDHGISLAGKLKNFDLSVRLRHLQGIGGGVLFNLPTPTSENGGHMVRFFEDNTVAWGYFDAAGVFTGQGYAIVPAPDAQSHSLKVISKVETYSLVLDDKVLVEDVPLVSPEGFVGLTTSTSTVEFDQINVVAHK